MFDMAKQWENTPGLFFVKIEVVVQYTLGCFSLANIKPSLLKRCVPFFIQNCSFFCCWTDLGASNWRMLTNCKIISLGGNGSLWLPLGSDTINIMANFLWKPWVIRLICKTIRGSSMLLECINNWRKKVSQSISFLLLICVSYQNMDMFEQQ